MSAPPSFSSFPDFSSKSDAGPSRTPTTNASAPSFSSFPELDVPGKRPRSHRSRSHSRDRDEARKVKRREEEEKRHRSERHRENKDGGKEPPDRRGRHNDERYPRDRSGRDAHRDDGKSGRSEEKERESDRRRDRDRDRNRDKHKHRSRSRDKEREKEKGGDILRQRDSSAERKYRDDRRRREREAAWSLIRGDQLRSSEGPERGRTEQKNGASKDRRQDEGVPWYESSMNGKKDRGGYEEPFDPTSSKAFFSDTVGDKDIMRYGHTSSTSVPRYYRDGRNRILGLNDCLRIVYSRERTQKGVEIAPLGKPYIPRYNSRQTESSASRHLQRIVLLPSESEDQVSFDPHSAYIDFGLRAPRKDQDDLPAYRSITTAEDDDDLSAIQAAIGSYSTLEEEVRKRTGDLEKHLRSHPEDVESWIDYSRLHLRLSPESERSSGLVDPAKLPTTRAKAEVTLSILSRAIDADEANMTSVKLHLAYLRAAEQIWSAEKITARWKNVLRELGERGGKVIEEGWMEIWLAYISWREGQGFGKGDERGGGVDEVIEVYIECIGKLKQGAGTGYDLQAREENLVYLFLRACLFIKQAGYAERALAAFQALMEITFFKPDHLRRQPDSSSIFAWYETILSDFEEFWDGESPRIGEQGAMGWRNTLSDPSDPSASHTQPIQHSSEDPFERWLEAELHAEQTYSLPGRATDLDTITEDDPYHIVLFSDIRPLLFPITTPEVRLQLIYAFLTFLGLPFSPPGVPSSSPANTDPHLRWNLAYNDIARYAFWPPKQGIRRIPWQTVGGEPMEPEHGRGMDDPFGCPVKCWTQDRSTMLARQGSWFGDLGAMNVASLDTVLIRNVFSLLRPLVPDPAFTLASFAFESAVSSKGAVKSAKSILASDRDNLLLWDGYARLERQRGNMSISRTVYVTALQAAQAARGANLNVKSEDEIDLWAGWAEMEWESGQEDRCLEVLAMAAGVGEEALGDHAIPDRTAKPISAVGRLKAKQYYALKTRLSSASHLLLSALFAYLTDGIHSARLCILDHLNELTSACAEAEEATQLLTKLLHYHTSRNPSPASLTRDTLESALSSFPNNTSFLSLYLYGELGGRVYGRVQRLMADLTSKEGGGIVSHLWAVWAEAVSAHRTFWDRGGGGAERVRLALDKGINSAVGRYSAPLWMLYIEFETLMERFSTAKQLCYRAVSTLGGCKELYLIPFRPALRPHFTTRELKDWGELMIERGVRLRVPFEHFWQDDEEEAEALGSEEEEDDVGNDELGFLREREALKPY